MAALSQRREMVEFDAVVTASLAGKHDAVEDGYELEADMMEGVAAAQAAARKWLSAHPLPEAGAALSFTAAEAEEARNTYIDAVEDVACGDDEEDDEEGEEEAAVAPAGADMD
mmetsp:Transcript_18969/g.66988  ORF Transcript_18969/g.66988 Transcript_18969/m.66988 type:complete len:113 (-) Transcript_18969:114-452(-)